MDRSAKTGGVKKIRGEVMGRSNMVRLRAKAQNKQEFVRSALQIANQSLGISDKAISKLANIKIAPSSLHRFRSWSQQQRDRGIQSLEPERLDNLYHFFASTLLGRGIVDACDNRTSGTGAFNRVIEGVMARSLGDDQLDFGGVFISAKRSSSSPDAFSIRAFNIRREADGACVFENFIKDSALGDDRNVGAILFGGSRPQLLSINLEIPDHFRLFSPSLINARDNAVQVMTGPLVGRNRNGVPVDSLQYLMRYRAAEPAVAQDKLYAELKAQTGRFPLSSLNEDFRVLCAKLIELERAEATRRLRELSNLSLAAPVG